MGDEEKRTWLIPLEQLLYLATMDEKHAFSQTRTLFLSLLRR